MKKIVIIVMAMFFCFTPFVGCATMDKGKSDLIRSISFSPDGKKLIFSRIRTGELHRIQVYNMETGDLAAYQHPDGERWIQARYSFDGKRIVFIAMPLIGNKEDFNNAQIALMDVDGKNVRKITKTPGLKIYPSFSHSGKKIIFARADTIRTSGETPAADYDLYEVDVETGRETRLTYFKFFEISEPYYYPDDKTFVFWGDFPRAYPAIPGSENIYVMKKIRKDLQSKYKHNSIYVMQANEKDLKPYLVMPEYQKKFKSYIGDAEFSRRPTLSGDGSILVFLAQGYKPDGSGDFGHLYQYSPEGNHRDITPFGTILDLAVSHKGDLIVVIQESKQTNDNIVIYKVKDGTSREIILPGQPSRIINGQ